MNVNEKYLPIGSVVLMKGAKKRAMITGYAVKSPESGDKLWDYIGCLYPEGMVTPDKNLLFDHENIDKIFAVGYSDEEQKNFIQLLNKATKLHTNREQKEAVKEESKENTDENTSNQ